MIVKDILKLSAILLGKEDIASSFDVSTGQSAEILREQSLLLRCANLILNELAIEFIPMIKVEEITTSDGIIYFNTLTENILSLKEIENNYENILPYKLYPEYIKTGLGAKKIIYSFIPSPKTLMDATGYSEKNISERAIAYGVCAEYSLISSMFDDALMWDKKYKDSIIGAIKLKKAKKIQARRWL